ncbi:uncharacterized protein LOC132721990 [Ruditapes philippinarum]|uniref:uncharacterized protein LOC132721990 n=1 Tax=Ruditapes philippinarum TaxID=129788 RepID=UPI00295A5F03|nr:uncharacterized protein LOC132721990 [Ruditapes philippinarum]
MSTTGTEKHCRLCLMLSKGGTKACHHLLLKRVEDLKPRDPQPNEWTLASFLNSKKQMIITSNLSKEKYKVLFPNTGATVLSNWDLSLYCHVLTSYCDLTSLDWLDIENLRTIRNDLCHMNDAEITDQKFESYCVTIQVIIGRILEKLDANDLKLELDTIINNLKSGPLSIDESLKEMRKFYLMELDIREQLEHVLEKLEELSNKFDQTASSGIDSTRNNVVPGVNIVLVLKNVNDEEEENMSYVLQQLFEEVINEDNGLKSTIPPNSYIGLRAAVNKTYQIFLSKGWKIISAKHKCIQLQIRCSNFKSLAALLREHINGQIDNHLTDLNESLTECVNGGKSCFQTMIYKDEFWNVLDKSISSVDRFLSEVNIDLSKQKDNVQPLNKGRGLILSLTAQNLMSGSNKSFEGDCNNELRTSLQLLTSELESEFHAPHLSIQGSCSTNVNCETDEYKEGSDWFQDEEYDKTAITQRSLKEIGPTKEAHERGKYHSEEKKEITEQNRLDRKLAMWRKWEEEQANWTKGISGLTITKYGLLISITEILKNFLYSFSPEQIGHLSEFLDNARNSNLKFITEKGKTRGSWEMEESCCKSGLCQTILDMLCEKQANNLKNVVWSPNDRTSVLHSRHKKMMTLPNTHFFNWSIRGEFDCPYERVRRGIPLLDDTLQQGDVDTYYWQIAKMYMFRGKETNYDPNTGPEDTDVALIFKLMKNCKLFSLDEESNIDNSIYDDLLEVRNLLMHSADSRLSDEALEECFERMKSILKADMFSSEHSKKAITGLEKLKDMRIIMTSLTLQQAALIEEAFNLQQSSVEFDIHFKGSLKNDYVLEGILKASQENSRKYKVYAQQSSATTLGGAATGAAVGSIAGPSGAAIGSAVGWLFGKLAE